MLAGAVEGPEPEWVRLPLVPETPLSLTVEGPRRCTSCHPARVIGSGGAGTCVGCRIGSPALATPGRTDAAGVAALEHLRQVPHVLYLALFGRHLVKVGVSANPARRLREQGAMAGLLVAAGDGVAMRQLERAVRQAGVPDVVRTQRKARLLAERPTPDEAQSALQSTAAGLASLTAEHPPAATFLYLADRYAGRFPEPGETITTPSRFWPGDRIGGRLRGAVGGLLLVDDAPLGLLAIDSSRLEGYRGRFTAVTGTSRIKDIGMAARTQPSRSLPPGIP